MYFVFWHYTSYIIQNTYIYTVSFFLNKIVIRSFNYPLVPFSCYNIERRNYFKIKRSCLHSTRRAKKIKFYVSLSRHFKKIRGNHLDA